jgi:hypothetical protein
MADVNTLLWSLIVAAYAVSIWVWTSDFGKQFPRRSRRRQRVIAANRDVGAEPPQWAA